MSIEPLSWGRGSTPHDVGPKKDTSGTPEGQLWSAPARGAHLESVRSALTREDSLGVVITGGRGVGKSSLARAAVMDLGPDVWSLQLRSGPAGSSTPYGCLSFLLARLPQAYMGSPTAILRGITSLIRSDAGGRPCVITLDTSGSIDDMSAGVLLNVLLTGTAKIVAVAPKTSDLPADFHWLLTDRRLTEVRLSNLNELQTRQVLLSLLGHRVSASLVSTYHQMVGGNPLLLKALVTEQQLSGNLVLSDSVWTLRDKVVLEGAASLDDIVRSRWSRETPETREVIEMLSCARRVELARLTAIFGAEVVANMEDGGLLEIDASDHRWVSLREKYIGDVVRTWLSIARRRELRSVLLGGVEPDPAGMSVDELMAFAAWTHECESELSPALALAAADAAVQLFDPKFALTYAEMLKRTDRQWVAGQCRKAAAYLQLDLPVQAMAALDDISQPELDSLDVEDYAHVVAAKSQVMLWLPDQAGNVPELLGEARTRLEEAARSAAWPEPAAAAANKVALSQFEYRAFIGDYAGIIPALEAAADPARNPDTGYRMNAAILLMTSLAMTGREMDALSIMRQLGGQISDASHIVGLRERYTREAYLVLLMAGQWRRCIDLLAPQGREEPHSLPFRSAATELAAGIAYVYSGRGAAALEPLISAAAQLELQPVQAALRCAHAAIALAHAQTGNAAQARKYLAKLQRTPGQTASFITESIVEFCAQVAGRWLGDPDAVAGLKQSARRNMEAGRFTLAGINLLAATVNGSDADFRLLEEIAGYRQGPLAEVSRLIAVGSRTKDAKTLLAGGELAATLELDAVEARCMALAVDFARQAGDPLTARTAQARLDILAATVSNLPIVPSSGSPLLTSRERQIARLAARGASNRDIALEMGVSVRTVEGHLYQVFTKLGVTSRGDLTGLV
ncbi:response regulator containing a CheY-like receiver domain and an HTH DNA-binding domain protein [Pseudarthrobacter phenanthrenivorans Sphe3]|uniref:Response regulator containing a CheY-like receiver domain and an HTH DNA-binding domain protein n=1 Tax=Pseudarthrobacter phenanthrenivorans (strain DSM 18606 / JCM 16027 / LMG 23796 / Sphe3) TaxID=930171 RepID=F0M5P7_PSEPM|nr:LuxR family transcriptional regulator [Pseudarthrobacter phenanthrenivorans]ADX72427.1 response regulator containing a CheY-like receiver domain and an HTH DNA-binding domain protein [Pseudarthrobacter phenanthrenivorans Sphe3]